MQSQALVIEAEESSVMLSPLVLETNSSSILQKQHFFYSSCRSYLYSETTLQPFQKAVNV